MCEPSWRRRGGRAALAAVVLAVAAAASLLPLSPRAAAQSQDDPALLRELAERLLSPPFAGPGGQAARPRLLLGALPPELPLDLPLPPGSRLVGSAVRPSFGREGPDSPPSGLSIAVVLDAPGAPADIIRFYQEALGSQGWSAPSPADRPPGGFLPSSISTSSSSFCRSPAGPWLSVIVLPQAAGPSDVRIDVDTGNPGPCESQPDPRPPGAPPGFDRLPPLAAPPGVQVMPRGGGGGDGFAESRAVAVTDRPAADLEAHYAAQLAAAGWSRLAGGTEGPVAWSVWGVPGEGSWYGFLFVLEEPGQNRRSLYVYVVSAAEQVGPGGGVRIIPVGP